MIMGEQIESVFFSNSLLGHRKFSLASSNRRFLILTCFLLFYYASAKNIPDDDVKVIKSDRNRLNKTFFVNEIFEKYGHDNVMTYEGFEHLLENLGLGQLKFKTKHDVSIHKINGTFREFHDELDLHHHDHQQNTDTSKSVEKSEKHHRIEKRDAYEGKGFYKTKTRGNQNCLTPDDILRTYGLEPYHDVVISETRFMQICPAIIYELDQKTCLIESLENESDGEDEEPEYYLVWIYASVSILIMSVAGLLCVAIVPIINKHYYSSILQFLVSLAVGTLCGDALIHLLPQVLSYDPMSETESASVLRGTVALFSIFLFYIIENTLKIIQNKSNPYMKGHRHGHSHSHNHDVGEVKPIAWMVIMGDILHNITDGLSIGASFSASIPSGFASSIAIFCHELPHELGDYAVLLKSGMSIKRSLFYNMVSSVFSFIGMVAGVLLGEIQFASLWINAFTAGSFLYIALSDLIPELKLDFEENPGLAHLVLQLLGIICGGVLMFSIALYEERLEDLLT